MKNVVGQAVVGTDLYGRANELRVLWDGLERGEHIHMLAPRRVGKTSLMLEVHRRGDRLVFRSNLLRTWWQRHRLGVVS